MKTLTRLFALLAVLAAQPLAAQQTREAGAVFALIDKNEWCAGGSVYLDLQTGSFMLYPRLTRFACQISKAQAPVEQGTVGKAPLQALRSAYVEARRAGLERKDCKIIVSNGGPESLVITGPDFSRYTPANEGCWSEEATALHNKLFQMFGRQREPNRTPAR